MSEIPEQRLEPKVKSVGPEECPHCGDSDSGCGSTDKERTVECCENEICKLRKALEAACEAALLASDRDNRYRERIKRLEDGLKRIANVESAPDIDASGEIQTGLHCGVEDRGCSDRYEGSDFGYSQGVERALEWAVNEAKYALEQLKETKP